MKKITYDMLPADFIELYTKALDSSLGLASLQVEGYTLNGDAKTVSNMMRQDSALQYAKSVIDPSRNNEYTYKFDLLYGTLEIAKRISDYEIQDFRKRPIEVIGSNVPRTDAYLIKSELLAAYDNYLYFLNSLNERKDTISDEIYEREFFENEARLHIRLLHIHPFEDYNGRTMRTILTTNLLKTNHAPAIITSDTKKEYNNYIENSDAAGLGHFLRICSLKEYTNMVLLYHDYSKNKKMESGKKLGQKKQHNN